MGKEQQKVEEEEEGERKKSGNNLLQWQNICSGRQGPAGLTPDL